MIETRGDEHYVEGVRVHLKRPSPRERAALAAGRGVLPQDMGVHELDGRPHLAVEWVEGDALDDAIAAREISLGRLCSGARSLFSEYAAMHALGVLHGDVAPRNLVLAPSGRLRPIDFDCAACPSFEPLSRGYPGRHTPPEMLLGRPYDALGEQYAIARCLTEEIEVLSGARPFSLLAAIARRPPILPPCSVPYALWTALVRMGAEEPSERFPSLETVVQTVLQSSK